MTKAIFIFPVVTDDISYRLSHICVIFFLALYIYIHFFVIFRYRNDDFSPQKDL